MESKSWTVFAVCLAVIAVNPSTGQTVLTIRVRTPSDNTFNLTTTDVFTLGSCMCNNRSLICGLTFGSKGNADPSPQATIPSNVDSSQYTNIYVCEADSNKIICTRVSVNACPNLNRCGLYNDRTGLCNIGQIQATWNPSQRPEFLFAETFKLLSFNIKTSDVLRYSPCEGTCVSPAPPGGSVTSTISDLQTTALAPDDIKSNENKDENKAKTSVVIGVVVAFVIIAVVVVAVVGVILWRRRREHKSHEPELHDYANSATYLQENKEANATQSQSPGNAPSNARLYLNVYDRLNVGTDAGDVHSYASFKHPGSGHKKQGKYNNEDAAATPSHYATIPGETAERNNTNSYITVGDDTAYPRHPTHKKQGRPNGTAATSPYYTTITDGNAEHESTNSYIAIIDGYTSVTEDAVNENYGTQQASGNESDAELYTFVD